MKFIDERRMFVCSGKGGDGAVSFRTARNLPKLGPDGGNGGRGGDVYAKADRGLNTLAHLLEKRTYKAEDGVKGGTNGRTGACGEHHYLEVPPGTVFFETDDSGESLGVVCEVLEHGQTALLAKGGHHGLGNLHFKSSTQRAPDRATKGGDGVKRFLKAELKVLAEVGLAGFPNAGKSTLLSKISNAKPKIADYPFTTLIPQLGIASRNHSGRELETPVVFADIPGLIEGAHTGKGLGIQFLKHLERTLVLLKIVSSVDETSTTPEENAERVFRQFSALDNELDAYSKSLSQKKWLVGISKSELVEPEYKKAIVQKFAEHSEAELLFFSSVQGGGMDILLDKIAGTVASQKSERDDKEDLWS